MIRLIIKYLEYVMMGVAGRSIVLGLMGSGAWERDEVVPADNVARICAHDD